MNCMYCGATVVVRQAIQAAAVASVPNLLKLARAAGQSANHKEAYDYFTRVLEIDASNADAWAGKAEAAGRMSGQHQFRMPEMITYFRNAVESAQDGEVTQVRNKAAYTICRVITDDYLNMRTGLSPKFWDSSTWTFFLNRVRETILLLDDASKFIPNNVSILQTLIWFCDNNSGYINYQNNFKREFDTTWNNWIRTQKSLYTEALYAADPSLRPSPSHTSVGSGMQKSQTTILLFVAALALVVIVVIVISVIVRNQSPMVATNKSKTLLPEVQVKRYPASVEITHDKIRIEGPNIKFAKASKLNEWFELEHTASCDKQANTPKAVVMTLTHETPEKSGWHFPSPTTENVLEPNANFAVTLKLQSVTAAFDKAHVLDLRKDVASDRTFYETFIADVTLDTLKKFGDQPETVTYELPGAQLSLTPKQSMTLYAFAHAALRCGGE